MPLSSRALPEVPPPLGRRPPQPTASKRWAELAEAAIARHQAGGSLHGMEPYREPLWNLWREGCHKIADLHRHLVEQHDYHGTARTVGRAVKSWRRFKNELPAPDSVAPPVPMRLPGPRWLAIELIRRDPSAAFVALEQHSPLLQRLRGLACTFLNLVCERGGPSGSMTGLRTLTQAD